MSSGGGKSSSKSTARNNDTALQEEEDCLAWLQYPTDDAFEKGYCCDFFQGGWPPSTVTDKLAIDVFSHGQEGSVASFSPTGSPPSSSVMQKHMGMMKTGLSSRPSRKVDAEEALAQGAARAAGLSWPAGAEPLIKLRTVMQPPAGGAIKQNLPLPAVPASIARALQSAKNPKAHMLDSHPPSKFNPAAASASTSASSKRSRMQYESHSHLQPESSRITEAGTAMRGYESVVADDDQAWARTSVSCSGASQTSMSLSGNEKLYIEKLKQEDSEFLLDDFTEDDFPRAQKQSKYSLKRNRVPEFHNLSERLRRNKINEKLKALQDLIPNSSKTDKASVLDEAIEYMKALQTQLQMVSMRNSLNASTITMPMSLPQTCLTMPQPQSIGIGVPLGHLGTGTVFGGMADMSLPMAPALFQCPTAVMSQMNAIPFHSQIMAGFAHLGVPQNAQILPTIANIQKKPTSIHWHQDFDQGWPLLQQPRMIEDETASIKQDDCSE